MTTNFPPPLHKPVLVQEILGFFKDRPISIFIDATLGAGGHAKALLKAHPEISHYIGIDQDPEALEIAKNTLSSFKNKVHFLRGNFQDMEKLILPLNLPPADGLLMDIGVSSMQLDQAEKGFSFAKEGPLDMRMDPDNPLNAEIIINCWPEKELGRIFKEFGEERHWRACAREIALQRKRKKFQSTTELSTFILSKFSRGKKQKIHPATRIFQALRICVNSELQVLQKALSSATSLLRLGGLLGVISFHSLEDRIVKEHFKKSAAKKHHKPGLPESLLEKKATAKILTKKPIVASAEETYSNPRSRSAKLRFIEKIESQH